MSFAHLLPSYFSRSAGEGLAQLARGHLGRCVWLGPCLTGISSTAHRAQKAVPLVLFPPVNGLFPAIMPAVHLYSPVHKRGATCFLNSGFSTPSVLYSYIYIHLLICSSGVCCYLPGSILKKKKISYFCMVMVSSGILNVFAGIWKFDKLWILCQDTD